MSKIITISREFGSGGRELGKRLADYMQIPCYDKEIIEEVSKLHGLDEKHIESISESDIRNVYPLTIGRRFAYMPSVSKQSVDILVSQQKVIKNLAHKGDCIFVGRCADITLKSMSPFNIFVYAKRQSKLSRCILRSQFGESQKEILRQMKRIDKNRASCREFLADTNWGKKEAYHLCINTSEREIKTLIPALAEYINCWFEKNK